MKPENLKCANCGANMLESGVSEHGIGIKITHEYSSEHGIEIKIMDDEDDARKYLECSICGAKTEFPASVLREYYHERGIK